MDSLSSPDLHRLLVPQLTRATCQQNRWLLPLWYQLRCWRRTAAHLYCTVLVVLKHSTSRVTCTIKHMNTLNEKSPEKRASLKVNKYWCNIIPVHAIWSLNGIWPPVQMKLSVTGILGLFVLMPSASKAYRMHSSLCNEKRKMRSLFMWKYKATTLTLKIQTHIIAKFSVSFLFIRFTAFTGQEKKFFKMRLQQFFLWTEKRKASRLDALSGSRER